MANEIDGAPLPPVADRDTWQAQLAELLVREKAHTREGDAIAAARRRLPMVEVESSVPLIGAQGPVRLLDVFEGRRQLIVYFHMWHTGQPAEAQCEGCTFFNGQEFGPGRGGSGTQLRAARHDGLWPPGILGGLAGGLAPAVRQHRRAVPY